MPIPWVTGTNRQGLLLRSFSVGLQRVPTLRSVWRRSQPAHNRAEAGRGGVAARWTTERRCRASPIGTLGMVVRVIWQRSSGRFDRDANLAYLRAMLRICYECG